MKPSHHSSYFRPDADKQNRLIHWATLVCGCFLAVVLGLVAWDYVAVHGKWLLWFIPVCFVLLVLVGRRPWLALAVYLGLH